MLDLGWTEIMVIGVVALIVVGPKDLPRMLRTLGQYTGKMRGMAREFQRSMDDAAREADLAEFKDIKKSMDDVRAIGSDAARAVKQGVQNVDREIEKAADTETKSPEPATETSDETPINAPADPIPVKTAEAPAPAPESPADSAPETPKQSAAGSS